MKNELIQLAEYLEALEARISDLEQRYDIMMQRSAEADEEMASKLNALGAALAEVNARLDDEMELEEEEVVEEAPVVKPQVVAEPEPVVAPQPEVKPAPVKPVGQNGELMQKTLEELNKQTDFDAAVNYLDRKFPQWDKESPAYELFINVLHRRFG